MYLVNDLLFRQSLRGYAETDRCENAIMKGCENLGM